MESLSALVAQVPVGAESGNWQRHVAIRYADAALGGQRAYGRWSTQDGFPVLYLGKPTSSVVVEAYRHLVDPVEGEIQHGLKPRILITCSVNVNNLLDLRSAGARLQLGLSLDILKSETGDTGSYARCQEVAQIAHQIGRHGVIAPAATGLGETLALFTDLLPVDECPIRLDADEVWNQLPPDPRNRPKFRVIRGGQSD